MLFYGSYYFPSGGAEDFKGFYDSCNECRQIVEGLINPDSECEWMNVLETATGKIVLKGRFEYTNQWSFNYIGMEELMDRYLYPNKTNKSLIPAETPEELSYSEWKCVLWRYCKDLAKKYGKVKHD